jgi:hypothetical protein
LHSKRHLFEDKCLLSYGLRDVIDIERHFALTQLWGIEGFQVIVVECRMLLRQTERLVCLPLLINIAEIGFAIQSVIALGGKDKPTAVAAP